MTWVNDQSETRQRTPQETEDLHRSRERWDFERERMRQVNPEYVAALDARRFQWWEEKVRANHDNQ